MRIRKCDLPLKTRIIDFGPNWFTHSAKLKGDQVELQTSFRSNEKYARRLWFAFEPLWWAFHAWDWLTKPWPAMNLGFDTLPTVYSTPGTSVSGYVVRTGVSESFATIRAGEGRSSGYDSGFQGIQIRLISTAGANLYGSLFRGIFLFDTSSLNDGATLTAASIGIYGSGKSANLGAFEVDIVSATPESNTVLANGDYANLGTTPFSSVAYASLSNAAYNTFSLNASGIATISKTGISKFGGRLNWDTDNSFTGTWYSSCDSRIMFEDGGTFGTTSDPKIDITYTLPNTTNFFNFL